LDEKYWSGVGSDLGTLKNEFMEKYGKLDGRNFEI
jgi:hypothetical protein